MNDKKTGFTLVEIIIVVAIIGLLAGLAIPNFLKQRRVANAKSCVNNLRVIDHAAQQWALEYKKAGTDTVPSPINSDSTFNVFFKGAWTQCPSNNSPYAGGFPIAGNPVCPNYGNGDEFTGHILSP
ncbi:MAG: prepilin-type N-terminal cleavage/methylation domain-containing protein [bacterium]